MKLLLTAPPNVGKSTVIASVVSAYPGAKCGIVAREMLDAQGKRIGFTSVNSAGDSRQFMFYTDEPDGNSVGGEFNVDVTAVDEFVVPEMELGLKHFNALIYVDEIGRAQAKSALFLSTLHKLLKSPSPLLASIVYDDEPWSLEFKRNPSLCLIEVSLQNRNQLPEILKQAYLKRELFSRLTEVQQELVYTLLRKFISSGQLISARKLFDNALPYLLENRLQILSKSADLYTYQLPGMTSNHRIVWNRKQMTFDCDCDLSNGRGMFTQKETCSHQMCVLLTHASCRVD